MGVCERRKARRPSTGLPNGTFPTPGSLTPCGVRSPGATRPSSLRDSVGCLQEWLIAGLTISGPEIRIKINLCRRTAPYWSGAPSPDLGNTP